MSTFRRVFLKLIPCRKSNWLHGFKSHLADFSIFALWPELKARLQKNKVVWKWRKAKLYRAFLNRINRRKGNYGNGDGLDEAHVGSSNKTTLQPESQNRANNRPRNPNSR